MLIDWIKFAPALCLLLLPTGAFHGKKIRFRPLTRDWVGHWSQILTLSLHWIDLARAALGGWLLVDSLTLAPGAAGIRHYSVPLALGAVMLVAVALQTFVCKAKDSAHAPFMFVTGLLLGVYPVVLVVFPLVLALTLTLGFRFPAGYFPLLALLFAGSGFLFKGKTIMLELALGCVAAVFPWLLSTMFRRELVVTYRAKRPQSNGDAPLAPPR